jgi:hypothetical protein
LNGADALVFTAGIGENEAAIRDAICANLDQLGIVLDPQKNTQTKAQEAVISAANSRVKVLVIPTNEELVVAREVKRFLESSNSETRCPQEIRNRKSEGPSPQSESQVLAKSFRHSSSGPLSQFVKSDFGFSQLSSVTH